MGSLTSELRAADDPMVLVAAAREAVRSARHAAPRGRFGSALSELPARGSRRRLRHRVGGPVFSPSVFPHPAGGHRSVARSSRSLPWAASP
jgi:hypothetical protein